MKKVFEIILVSITIIFSILVSYYQVNRLEGTYIIATIFHGSLLALSMFYVIGLKNKLALIFQTLFIFGLIGQIFYRNHWPGEELAPLLYAAMLGTSFLCTTSTEVVTSIKTQKLLMQILGICIVIYVLGFFVEVAFIQKTSYYSLFGIMVLLSFYFVKKDRVKHSFENILKNHLVYFTAATISAFGMYLK